MASPSARTRSSKGSASPGRTSRSAAKAAPSGEVQVRFRAPGPGAYKTYSTIGPQVDSMVKTAATVLFGTGAQREREMNSDFPGPGAYYKDTKPGQSVDSRVRSSPIYSMRGREKFGSGEASDGSAKTPGPGAYGRATRVGDHVAPAYTIRQRTDVASKAGLAPGPGRYGVPSGMGKQAASTKLTEPAFGFGTSVRKPIITPQSDVGPGDYASTQSVGKQALSTSRSAAAVKFGTSVRQPLNVTDKRIKAGPGSYQMKGAMGAQVSSLYKTSGRAVMSGRTRFGSPYDF